MSDDPNIFYNVRRAIHVGLPTPLVLDPGTGPSQETLHEDSAGRRGENQSEKDRLRDLLKRKEFFNDELRSTKDLIRIQKEKTAGIKLAAHLLDRIESDFEKDAKIFSFLKGMFGRGAAARGAGAGAARAQTARAARTARGGQSLMQSRGFTPTVPKGTAPPRPVRPVGPRPVIPKKVTLTKQPTTEPAPGSPAKPPSQQDVSKQIQEAQQKAFQQSQQLESLTDPQAMKMHGQLTGRAPGKVKQFLAGGTGQFLSQMGLMMFPYHKIFGEESALSQVAPMAAFMLAPGALSKYTGAQAARTGLRGHMAGGGKLPGLPKGASAPMFHVTSVVSTPGVITNE